MSYLPKDKNVFTLAQEKWLYYNKRIVQTVMLFKQVSIYGKKI